MNSRERFLTAMRRSEPDRVPFDFALGFSQLQTERLKSITGHSDPNEYFNTDVRNVGGVGSREPCDHSRYHPMLPARAWVDEWGIGHLPTQSDSILHGNLEGFIYPMLQLTSAQDARDYPLPDIDAAYRYEGVSEQVSRLHDRGLAVAAHMQCTIFEIAWYMRSMERLLIDFYEHSTFASVLLDRITALRCAQARHLAASGADVIGFGDDIGSQRGLLMRLSMWRTWIKPCLAQVIDAARETNPDILVFYHSDGNVEAAVADLIDIGVDILNPVQPECMDPAHLKREYGRDLSFWGTIGTQSTFPFGSPDDVVREVRHRIETVGVGGGLMIAPTHMVEPDVPWENIIAMVDTVKNSGSASRE